MATHPEESPTERLARYCQLSEGAAKSAINAPDFETTKGFFQLAGEWEKLADEARTEFTQHSINNVARLGCARSAGMIPRLPPCLSKRAHIEAHGFPHLSRLLQREMMR